MLILGGKKGDDYSITHKSNNLLLFLGNKYSRAQIFKTHNYVPIIAYSISNFSSPNFNDCLILDKT